jgi:hypothetical protein
MKTSRLAKSPFHGEENVAERRESESASTVQAVLTGLRALQRVQEDYDDDLWDITDPPFAYARHVHLHLSITVGKLARMLEPYDHVANSGSHSDVPRGEDLEPIVADLLLHAAQLANEAGMDLGAVFASRYRQNAKRFAPESSLTRFGA